jgi:Xaa-Pro aminopeptidase
MDSINRLKILQSGIKNPILIKKKENLFYLTGRSFDYRAEEYLLVKPMTADKKRNITDGIIGFGSGLENMDWIKKSDRLKNIGQYVKGYKELGIEWGFSYGEGEYLKFKIPNSKFKIKPELSPVDEMRQVKEPEELDKIRKSMQIVEKVFGLVRKKLIYSEKRRKITEIELAQFIISQGFKIGAEDISFPAIVASGANAAIPHHVPSQKVLKAGESIIIDFGFKYKNYCSDFTRTVFLKKVPKKLEIAYNQVEKAYNGSMQYIDGTLLLKQKSPIKQLLAGDVYQKSVDILAEKKLDKYFIHSLGHGTGLEIHELPNLSPKSKDVLKNGMVFSIEPGVYMPRLGGIRIEDLVYLENGKVKKFINVPTQLTSNIL